MTTGNLKTRWMQAAALLLLAIAAMNVQGDATRSTGDEGAGSVRTAGYGGVLVPKRVRIVIGFVQTLPA